MNKNHAERDYHPPGREPVPVRGSIGTELHKKYLIITTLFTIRVLRFFIYLIFSIIELIN